MRNKVRKQVSGSLITGQETLSNENGDGVKQSALVCLRKKRLNADKLVKKNFYITCKTWVKYPPAMGLLCQNKKVREIIKTMHALLSVILLSKMQRFVSVSGTFGVNYWDR